jgi:hypothetical protein
MPFVVIHHWYFIDTTNNQVYNSDLIRTLQLSSFVRDRLREAEAICGSQAFQELYLSQADPTVLKQIQDALAAGL